MFVCFKGICFEVYSPLGNPARPTIDASDPVVLEDSTINDIAKKHNATAAQVHTNTHFTDNCNNDLCVCWFV